jgi:hypothetical protein
MSKLYGDVKVANGISESLASVIRFLYFVSCNPIRYYQELTVDWTQIKP